MKIKKPIISIINVLKRKNYFIFSVITSFIFFSLGIIPKNFTLLKYLIGKTTATNYLNTIYFLYYEWFKNSYLHSIIIFILISILVGITISLISFKIKSRKKFKKIFTGSGTTGIFLGILVPACVPCGIGILYLLGLSSVIAFLPYQGSEIGVISIFLLLFSILVMGKDIDECGACQIEIKSKRKRI